MAEEEKRKDIGAIWVQRTRKGDEYLSMSIEIDGEKRSFVAFKNNKAKDSHPDWRIYPVIPRNKPQPQPKQKTPDPEQAFDDFDD